MSLKKTAEKLAAEFWERDRINPPTTETVPSPNAIAFLVNLDRGIRGWKAETLASIADVHLSTVERVERGEKVSDGSLDKIAVALGRPAGAFTAPRVLLNLEQTLAVLEQSNAPFEDAVEITVNLMWKQKQVRDLLNTHALWINDGGLPEDSLPLVEELRAKLRRQVSTRFREAFQEIRPEPGYSLKRFYEAVLADVRAIERSARAVALTGVYSSECLQDGKPTKLDFGYVGFFTKDIDPAASKRRRLFLPRDLRNDGMLPAFDG